MERRRLDVSGSDGALPSRERTAIDVRELEGIALSMPWGWAAIARDVDSTRRKRRRAYLQGTRGDRRARIRRASRCRCRGGGRLLQETPTSTLTEATARFPPGEIATIDVRELEGIALSMPRGRAAIARDAHSTLTEATARFPRGEIALIDVRELEGIALSMPRGWTGIARGALSTLTEATARFPPGALEARWSTARRTTA